MREAVYAAVHDTPTDAADTIAIPAGTYVLTRTGEFEDGGLRGDLDITGTLTLTGATSATTIIDGNGADRILDIFAGDVTLEHLTLRNGRAAGNGGGVRLHAGELTVRESALIGNFAHDGIDDDLQSPDIRGGAPASGGGISNQAAGHLLDLGHDRQHNHRRQLQRA